MITLLGEDDKEQKIPSNLPTLKSAPIGSKVAKDAAAQNLSADFAREYLTNETLASAPHGKQKSVFLSEELAQTAISSYDRLTSSQLMRLLHHHDISHVNAARRVLASRDGFSESHLQLAYRLYHPDHERRRELVTRLSETPGTRNAAWLRELLNDPDNNVRYQAASFLATSQDLNLRLLLIEKGQHDRDARIVQLAERLRTIQP